MTPLTPKEQHAMKVLKGIFRGPVPSEADVTAAGGYVAWLQQELRRRLEAERKGRRDDERRRVRDAATERP